MVPSHLAHSRVDFSHPGLTHLDLSPVLSPGCLATGSHLVVSHRNHSQVDVSHRPHSPGPVSPGPVSSGPVSSGPVSPGPVSSGPVTGVFCVDRCYRTVLC